MKNIVRVYVLDPKTKREKSIMEPDQVIKVLSSLTEDTEIDYDTGKNVRMGTTKELIGETVKVGEFEILIPKH